ncbi:MAG: histidine kinase [Ignavibacteriae bacterium]|nr:histidine kinase [Ignavibacteriota bacterium]
MHAIAQTQDGYLWFGTEEGLVRFNGVEFHVFTTDNSSLRSNYVYELLVSRDGTLWIVSYSGLTSLKEGTFTDYTIEDGLPGNAIFRIFEDSKARLWVGTSVGLFYHENGVFGRIELPRGRGLLISLAETPHGEILIGMQRGLYVYRHGEVSRHPSRRLRDKIIRALYVDRDGSIWAGLAFEGVVRLDSTGRVTQVLKQGLLSNVNWAIKQDRKGTLWVATKFGVVRISKGKVTPYTSAEGLSGDDIRSLYEDREGTLWIGTLGGGVNALTSGKFVTYVTGSTSSENLVFSISGDENGNLWAGNAAGQVFKFAQNKFVWLPAFGALAGIPINSVLNDPASGFWIGTQRGLYRFRNGKREQINLGGDNSGAVRALYKDRSGNVWAGAWNGLYRFARNSVERFGHEEGLWSSTIRSIYQARNGDLWVGTFAGLFKGSNGVFTAVIVSEDSSQRHLGPVYEDSAGAIWVGSIGEGLRRIKDGNIVAITKAHGLFDNTSYRILDDGSGNLWISCNNGIYSVSIKELNDVADGRARSLACKSYNEADGMKDGECNGGVQPAGWKTKDGKLWFPTIMGIAMVNTRSLKMNTTVPPVVIERALVERTAIDVADGMTIAPGKNDIEFHYACLSYRSPSKVRYKYRLAGYDNEWVDAGTRRFAQYNNLPPGRYTFRVIASNDDGVWNEAGASLAFELEPFFYQTTLFFVVCAGVVLVLSFGGIRWYGNVQERKVTTARLHSQLAEANLHALRMQLQPHFLFNTLNGISALVGKSPKAAQEMIARLAGLLRLTLESDLGQEVDLEKELQILRRYLDIEQTRFGDRLVVTYKIQDETQDALVPAFILQPLVENSIRHGLGKKRGAALIEIQSEKMNGKLKLCVRDNGRGFDQGAERDAIHGVGLTNTRARLNLLYGSNFEFDISPIDIGGVEAVISIPFHVRKKGEHSD